MLKLYFKDCKDEDLWRLADQLHHSVTIFRRGDGYRNNMARVKEYINFTDWYILTNDEQLLNHPAFYNKSKSRWEVYIMRQDGTYNIQDLTDKQIQQAHNITKMYCNGVFDL